MAEYFFGTRLDQVQPVLPWSKQTLWNKRSSPNLDGRKDLAWLVRNPGKNGLVVDIELLNSYLLARGLQDVALEVLIRVYQVHKYGHVFRGQKLGCSFGVIGCSSGQCKRCMTLRLGFRSLMISTQLESIELSPRGFIAGLTKLLEDSASPRLQAPLQVKYDDESS